jgi:hypothetical protein
MFTLNPPPFVPAAAPPPKPHEEEATEVKVDYLNLPADASLNGAPARGTYLCRCTGSNPLSTSSPTALPLVSFILGNRVSEDDVTIGHRCACHRPPFAPAAASPPPKPHEKEATKVKVDYLNLPLGAPSADASLNGAPVVVEVHTCAVAPAPTRF